MRGIPHVYLTISPISEMNDTIVLDVLSVTDEFETDVVNPILNDYDWDDISELAKTTLHEVGLEGLLRFSKTIGTLPPKVVLIGCKPKNITVSLDLSPEVEESTFKAANMVLNLIEKEKKLVF